MNKYKLGDKVVLTVTGTAETGYFPRYVLNDNFNLWKQSIDELVEPLTTYTEPLEAKIRRQAAEITRLLAENKELKEESKRNYTINIEMARAEGHSEAWELARKIASTAGGLSSSELVEIFNAFLPRDILSENTYPEAAAKVEAWEKGKEGIKKGDVVVPRIGSAPEILVLCVINGKMTGISIPNGGTFVERDASKYTKTGRHIDIDSFLKQIGGEQK